MTTTNIDTQNSKVIWVIKSKCFNCYRGFDRGVFESGNAVLANFLFSCPSSSRPTLVTHSRLCHCVGFKAFQTKPLLRKHDLTNKKTTTKTNTKTKTKTMKITNTFREHLQRAIFENFDL